MPHVRSWWYISDRVAAIELSIPTSQGKSTYCRVIDAYGPTLQKASENPSLLDCFYAELSKAVFAPSHYQVFVCGDFNSKLGTLSPEDEEIGLSYNMGVHSKGKKNKNGEALLQFLIQQGLFACNTAFEHPSHHKTTWTGWIPHPSNPSTSIPDYKQIDYILCKTTSKCLLTDARSYGGATLSSDHKPVVARLQFSILPLVWKRLSRKSNVKFNVQQLCTDSSVQDRYNIVCLSVWNSCHERRTQTHLFHSCSPASTNQLRLPLESLYLTKDLTMFKTTLLPHYHNKKAAETTN